MESLPEELKKELLQVATLIEANKAGEALQRVNQILLAHPGNVHALLQKSLALINQGKISDAQSILDTINRKKCSASIISKIEKLNGAIRSKCWRSLPTELQHMIFSLVDTRQIIFVSKQWQSVALAPLFVIYAELSSSPHFQLWIDVINCHNSELWKQWCRALKHMHLPFDPTKAIKISQEDVIPKLGNISWRKWLAKIREVRDKGDYFKKLLEEHRNEFGKDYCALFSDDKTLYKAAYQMYWQVRIKAVPEPNEDNIPLGRSKFGGCPDLPDSWIPRFTTPNTGLVIPQLLLQLNLGDIPDDFHCKRLLPKYGIFYVLVNSDSKNLYDNARLHFYSPNSKEISEKFLRLRPIGATPGKERHVYKTCRVEFKQILTVGRYTHNLPLFDLTDEEDQALASVTNFFRKKYGMHALLGLSTPFQRTYEACQQKYCDEMNLQKLTPTKNGKNSIYNDYHSDHVLCSRDYPHRCLDRLLLELETDQDWMFGDNGLTDITIHQHDLNASKFDRIRHHFDSH